MPLPIPTFIWTSRTTMNSPDNSPIRAEVSNGYTEGASYEHQPYLPTYMMTATPKHTELGPGTGLANTNIE